MANTENEAKKCCMCGKSLDWFDVHFGENRCWECNIKIVEAEQAELFKNDEITSTSSEEDIVCPWCGKHYQDEEGSVATRGFETMTCSECGKVFKVEAEVRANYSTERVVSSKLTEANENGVD